MINVKIGTPSPSPQPETQPERSPILNHLQGMENDPQSESAALSEQFFSGKNEPDFDSLISATAPAPQLTIKMGREDFHQNFVGLFHFAHLTTGLQSLKIDTQNYGAAKSCAEALYETIEETPVLHFLLDPRGKWLQRGLAMGAFIIPVASGVKIELAARRRPAPAARPTETPPAATAKPLSEGGPDAGQAAALTGH